MHRIVVPLEEVPDECLFATVDEDEKIALRQRLARLVDSDAEFLRSLARQMSYHSSPLAKHRLFEIADRLR